MALLTQVMLFSMIGVCRSCGRDQISFVILVFVWKASKQPLLSGRGGKPSVLFNSIEQTHNGVLSIGE